MRLRVLVKPGQRADGLWRAGNEADVSGATAATDLVAHVRAVPKDGEANAYLERLLAERLSVAPSLVRVVKGQASRHKIVEISADESAVCAAISALPELSQVNAA